MKQILFSIFSLLVTLNLFAQDESLIPSEIENYIAKYKQFAIDEQVRVGIPASIIIAQGIHESSAGKSELATKGNNHFGIKCKKDWKGDTILHDDDNLQECFRKYSNDLESYTDHSNFLKNNRRYSFLFDIAMDDYKEWAIGLRKAGYATNPKYSARLIELIEKYKLNNYTKEAAKIQIKKNEESAQEAIFDQSKIDKVQAEKTKKKLKEKDIVASEPETKSKSNTLEEDLTGFAKKVKETVVAAEDEEMLNGLRGFYAKKDDLLLQEAVKRNIRYAKLLDLNDLEEGPLPFDMFIYLEKKYKTSAVKRYHVVAEGESMLAIAQLEAMQLKSLMTLNQLEIGEEPALGARIFLQEKTSRKPILAKKQAVTNIATMEQAAIPKTTKADVDIAQDIFTKSDNGVAKSTATKVVEPVVEKVNDVLAKPVEATNLEESKIAVETIQEKNIDDTLNKTEQNIIVKTISAAEIAEQQMQLANDISNTKTEGATPVVVQIEKIIPQDARIIEKNTAATKETIVMNKMVEVPQQIVTITKPVLKSPSNYNEEGVSEELRKMKKVMDEIVYAVPPIPKPKVIIAPQAVPNPSINKTVTIAPSNHKPSTITTTTGSAKKEAEKKQTNTSKPNDKKVNDKKPIEKPKTNNKVLDKKTEDKKTIDKKVTDKKELAKKANDKKDADKKDADKKATIKKVEPKKATKKN